MQQLGKPEEKAVFAARKTANRRTLGNICCDAPQKEQIILVRESRMSQK
jgi:hypothetical protein